MQKERNAFSMCVVTVIRDWSTAQRHKKPKIYSGIWNNKGENHSSGVCITYCLSSLCDLIKQYSILTQIHHWKSKCATDASHLNKHKMKAFSLPLVTHKFKHVLHWHSPVNWRLWRVVLHSGKCTMSAFNSAAAQPRLHQSGHHIIQSATPTMLA